MSRMSKPHKASIPAPSSTPGRVRYSPTKSSPTKSPPTKEEKEMQSSHLLIQKYQLEIQDYTTRLNELYTLSDQTTDLAVLADFDATIQDLTIQRDVTTKLLSEAEQKAFVAIAPMAPIRKLPAELLAMILVFYVTDCGHNPWKVLSICRSWRNIAFSTPWMWNKIHVRIDYSQIYLPSLSQSPLEAWSGSQFLGGILCKGSEQLKFVLKRSGVVPLDVRLEMGGNTSSKSCTELMNLLWTQNGHRWRHVEIKEQSHYGLPQPNHGWKAPNPSNPLGPSLPHLESLRIESDYPGAAIRNFLEVVEKNSTKLHTLHISRIKNEHLPSIPKLMRQTKHASWQYTSLSLTNGVWAVGSSSSKLETLAVMGPVTSPFLGVSDKRYARLHTLAMSFAYIDGLKDHAQHLRALTHVALCHIDHPSMSMYANQTPAPHSILLPSVTHFTLASQTYNLLPLFHLPSLESLELYGCLQNKSDANDILERTWNLETVGKSPCPSRIFHLETAANDAYILAVIRYMTDVRQLFFHFDGPASFSPSGANSKLAMALAKGPGKATVKKGEAAIRAWRAPHCPMLEELTIVCKNNRNPLKENEKWKEKEQEEREACMDELRKIQQARQGTASHMKKVDILVQNQSRRMGYDASENRAHDLLPDFQ